MPDEELTAAEMATLREGETLIAWTDVKDMWGQRQVRVKTHVTILDVSDGKVEVAVSFVHEPGENTEITYDGDIDTRGCGGVG